MPGRLAGSIAVLCLAGAVLSTAAAAVPGTDVGGRAFDTWQQAR